MHQTVLLLGVHLLNHGQHNFFRAGFSVNVLKNAVSLQEADLAWASVHFQDRICDEEPPRFAAARTAANRVAPAFSAASDLVDKAGGSWLRPLLGRRCDTGATSAWLRPLLGCRRCLESDLRASSRVGEREAASRAKCTIHLISPESG